MTDVLTRAAFANTVSRPSTVCPSCAGGRGREFYRLEGAPVHQVRLVCSREAALACRKGTIALHVCPDCGFIWNAAFEPALVDYSDDYESTQNVSPVFRLFHAGLAERLVERFALRGKHVAEIGCGQGEFLALLSQLGVARVTGFDPVLRNNSEVSEGVELVRDWFSEDHAGLGADFLVSKMVLEHIPDPERFFAMLGRAVGRRTDVTIFHMMPEVTRILRLRAFWDIYYEHCAYFSLGSLARAARGAGFQVVDCWAEYDSQYACIAMRPGLGDGRLPAEESPDQLVAAAEDFAADVEESKARWRDWLRGEAAAGRRLAMWGGGSKGVAFLTSLGLGAEVPIVVDLNPKRHGTYIAGTGHRIIQPAALPAEKPDVVLIMSPIYRGEIETILGELGLRPRVVSVEADPSVAA
jgi:SAM-dependent methyltransferase